MTVEDRLRGALAARAAQITADRLQPALPPTVAVAGRRRVAWLVPLLAGAAAVALLFTIVLGNRPAGEAPATVPSPAVSSSPAPPAPAPGGHGLPAPPGAAPGSPAAVRPPSVAR
jgi:hypothetical protein